MYPLRIYGQNTSGLGRHLLDVARDGHDALLRALGLVLRGRHFDRGAGILLHLLEVRADEGARAFRDEELGGDVLAADRGRPPLLALLVVLEHLLSIETGCERF